MHGVNVWWGPDPLVSGRDDFLFLTNFARHHYFSRVRLGGYSQGRVYFYFFVYLSTDQLFAVKAFFSFL